MSELARSEACRFCGSERTVGAVKCDTAFGLGWPPGSYSICKSCAASSAWNRRRPDARSRQTAMIAGGGNPSFDPEGWWHGGQ
jgi:hypothetical protein